MPDDVLRILVLTFGAGLCIPLGGLLARVEHIRPAWLETEFRHFVIAFGGGLLLGAVFEVLLPEGAALLVHPLAATGFFMLGGAVFFALERALALRRRDAPQLTGMLIDYLPESVALGGLATSNPSLALVLALVIGLQNVPEGFNAYRELIARRAHPRRVLQLMFGLSLTGPLAGLAAHAALGDHPRVLGAIMLVAAGGIMYLMFQDIAPQARLQRHWAPPLGAVAGFGATMLANAGLTSGA